MKNKIGQMAEKILIISICTIEIDNFTYYIFLTKEKHSQVLSHPGLETLECYFEQ